MTASFLKKALFTIVLMLLSVGLIMVYSTSALVAQMDSATGNPYFFVKKQILWMVLAFAVFFLCLSIPYHWFERHAYSIFGVAFFLILLVLIPGIGVKYNGARRWIRMFGFGVQPSDFMKIAMVILIAAYLERNLGRMKNFFVGFLPIFSILSFSCLLILLEPDLGTSGFIFLVGMSLLWIGGIRIRHLLPLLGAGVPVFLFLMVFKLQHIYARIHIYFNPDLDPLGKGYQIRQSLMALGSGGPWGLGLGWSQQKLFFLSEESTDFIFAILGEELGFCGAALTVSFYALLLYFGLTIARRAPDIFSMVVAWGITMNVALQAIFNIAVVTHTIPAKGISLPFLSFGGSGLFFTMMGMGILMNIAGHARERD